jgi:hypothetical protein
MMSRWSKIRQAPTTLWVYLAGTAVLVGLSFVPSSVHTAYSVKGALIEFALLLGLLAGSRLCLWLLVVLGVLVSIGGVMVQTLPLDPVATGWSVCAILVTGLLLLPPSRRHADGRLFMRGLGSRTPHGAPPPGRY